MTSLQTYSVWDRTTRLFHWVNVLAVLTLIGSALVILNGRELGLSGDGRVLIKVFHVTAGYVFVLNLAWRLVWAFVGGPFARWRAFLPGGAGFMADLRDYLNGSRTNYRGHSPLGRIAVSIILLALVVQGATGLVLAGTDIFYPPFGSYFAEWIAAEGVDPATLVPGARDMMDEAARSEMRAFRAPFIDTHKLNFYLIVSLIILHIAAVVRAELTYAGGIISAMFTGRKNLPGPPEDGE